MKIKKTIKAKSKKRKKPYFGKAAHNAIVQYQLSNCRQEKNKIYNETIRASFEKLTENLIFIHGISSDKETFELIKNDCVSFLYETLEKFDASKGSKAFSYFNVCAKNFLIIQSKKKSKRKSRIVSIFDDNLSNSEKFEIENFQIIPSQEDTLIIKENKESLQDLFLSIKKKLTNKNEILCCDAIITLFSKIEELDYLNKRAIFVYLRELSGLNPKQLSVSMSNIRKHYRDLVKNNTGQFFIFK